MADKKIANQCGDLRRDLGTYIVQDRRTVRVRHLMAVMGTDVSISKRTSRPDRTV